MANALHIVPTEFKDLVTGETVNGLRVFDGETSAYADDIDELPLHAPADILELAMEGSTADMVNEYFETYKDKDPVIVISGRYYVKSQLVKDETR